MKDAILDTMVALMPVMKPLVYAGAATFLLGAVAAIARAVVGEGGSFGPGSVICWLAGWLLWALGSFLLLFQGLGLVLGAAPGINFGPANSLKFQIVPFWHLGLMNLAIGALLLLLSVRFKIGTRINTH